MGSSNRLLTRFEIIRGSCHRCREGYRENFITSYLRHYLDQCQADDLAKLRTRRRGKLLVLDVGARITSANQKWIEVPGDEDDVIDMLVEFTDEDGNGIGKGSACNLRPAIPISRNGQRMAWKFSQTRNRARCRPE